MGNKSSKARVVTQPCNELKRYAGGNTRVETRPGNAAKPSAVPPKQRYAGGDIMCNLCASQGDECRIPIGKVTARCAKNRTVCESCLERHILQCVEKSCFEVGCVCVSAGCREKLTFNEISQHASKELFTRYDDGMLHTQLEKDPEFCWCARTGCGSGQLHIRRSEYPIVRCHACKFRTCFTHHCEWHQGRTCQQYDKDAQESEEVGLLQMLEDRTRFRRCPACQHGVEKNLGCDHMTCRCKHEFCWRCLAPYQGEQGIRKAGRKAHKRSCHHYKNG